MAFPAASGVLFVLLGVFMTGDFDDPVSLLITGLGALFLISALIAFSSRRSERGPQQAQRPGDLPPAG